MMQRYFLICLREVFTLSRFCATRAGSNISNYNTKVMTRSSGLLVYGFKHLKLIMQSFYPQQTQKECGLLILGTFEYFHIVILIQCLPT